MIDIDTRIHDRYSIELKMEFVAGDKSQENDFTVGMWIFVPESLDINSNTFTKAEFYRCVKSNVRLITPYFPLGEIVGGRAIPFNNVLSASPENYEYTLKMFCAIVKSSLRESLAADRAVWEESQEKAGALIEEDLRCCNDILERFYTFPEGKTREYCGEFLCNRIAAHCFKIIAMGYSSPQTEDLLRKIYEIRDSRGYAQVSGTGSQYLHRHSVLKKLVESQLYLRAPKKKDGMLAEQAMYSLAAGFAMIFATVVAWAFQRTFGNLTWPLFIALIISYMMKDRIKELMRFYFAHKLGDRYYDNKARIDMRGQQIGWMKEAMDFITADKIPPQIDEFRNAVHLFDAENGNNRETVILYKKRVKLDKAKLEENSFYEFNGIKDIVRIQFRPFLRKMDDPVCMVSTLSPDGKVVSLPCERNYYMNLVLQIQSGESVQFKRFRITLNTEGVKAIEPVE